MANALLLYSRMKKFLGPVIVALLATAAFAQDDGNEDTRLPGAIRFAPVGEAQAILLDGEKVGSGSRAAKEILVAPGTYVVTIIDSRGRTACNTRVQVRENESVVASCVLDSERRLAIIPQKSAESPRGTTRI